MEAFPLRLIFTKANWNEPQTVTVTGMEGGGDDTTSITVSVDTNASDAAYASVQAVTASIDYKQSTRLVSEILTRRNFLILLVILALILVALLISRFPFLLAPIGAILPSSRSDIKTVMQQVSGIEDNLRRLESSYQPQSRNPSTRRPSGGQPSGSSPQPQNQNDRLTLGRLQRELDQVTAERDEERAQRNLHQPALQRIESRLDESEQRNRRLQSDNEDLNNNNRQTRNEQEIELPRAIRERVELSKRVRDLGGALNNVVAELVAEYEIRDENAELNQRYWAVVDRLRLLGEVLRELEVQERHHTEQEMERSRNSDRITRNLQELEALNVRRGIGNIKALSEGAGVESSAAIAAILDDMLASVPQRTISSETTSQINEYSAHVDGLGINTRFIPRALIEICRELVANAPPDEVENIEIIISKVLESARTRF